MRITFQFVDAVYKSMSVSAKNKKCVTKSAAFTDRNIRQYAENNKFSFICINTRGDGKIKKIFGTNKSNLINHSTVPVIAVPHNYRPIKRTNILYASDLVNPGNELKKAVSFAKPLTAKVELLHFNYPEEITAKVPLPVFNKM